MPPVKKYLDIQSSSPCTCTAGGPAGRQAGGEATGGGGGGHVGTKWGGGGGGGACGDEMEGSRWGCSLEEKRASAQRSMHGVGGFTWGFAGAGTDNNDLCGVFALLRLLTGSTLESKL